MYITSYIVVVCSYVRRSWWVPFPPVLVRKYNKRFYMYLRSKGAYVEDRVVCYVRVEMCTRQYTTAVPVNIINTYISNRHLYGVYIMDTVVYHAAAVSYRFVFYVRPYCCTPFSSVNELWYAFVHIYICEFSEGCSSWPEIYYRYTFWHQYRCLYIYVRGT